VCEDKVWLRIKLNDATMNGNQQKCDRYHNQPME